MVSSNAATLAGASALAVVSKGGVSSSPLIAIARSSQ